MEGRSLSNQQMVASLRANPGWQEFRQHFLERQQKDYQLKVMQPANSQEELMAAERAKGAYLALSAILGIVDANFPNEKGPNDVDDD